MKKEIGMDGSMIMERKGRNMTANSSKQLIVREMGRDFFSSENEPVGEEDKDVIGRDLRGEQASCLEHDDLRAFLPITIIKKDLYITLHLTTLEKR